MKITSDFPSELRQPLWEHRNVKRSRQIALILLTCGFIAVVVAVIWPGKPEPMYNGKSLSEWKEMYKRWLYSDVFPPEEREVAMSRQAVKAAHEMRADIIPIALKDIQCETPAWPSQMAEKIGQSEYLSRWCPNSIWMLLNEDRGRDGAIYFGMLGPDGSPAVPDLVRIMNQTKSNAIRKRAMFVLGHIGDDGLKPLMEAFANPKFPNHEIVISAIGLALEKSGDVRPGVQLLVTNLTNSDDTIFSASAGVLGRLALEPESVVPALANYLQSPNNDRRAAAVFALREFGNKTQSAMPSLMKTLGVSDELVQYFATNTLGTFFPNIEVTNK
jgi:hypothetical protein